MTTIRIIMPIMYTIMPFYYDHIMTSMPIIMPIMHTIMLMFMFIL